MLGRLDDRHAFQFLHFRLRLRGSIRVDSPSVDKCLQVLSFLLIGFVLSLLVFAALVSGFVELVEIALVL